MKNFLITILIFSLLLLITYITLISVQILFGVLNIYAALIADVLIFILLILIIETMVRHLKKIIK